MTTIEKAKHHSTLLILLSLLAVLLPSGVSANMIFPTEIISISVGVYILAIVLVSFINAFIEWGVLRTYFKKDIIDANKFRNRVIKINLITFFPTQLVAWLGVLVTTYLASPELAVILAILIKLIPETIPVIVEYHYYRKNFTAIKPQRIFKGVLLANIVSFLIGLIVLLPLVNSGISAKEKEEVMNQGLEMRKQLEFTCNTDSDCKNFSVKGACYDVCATGNDHNEEIINTSTTKYTANPICDSNKYRLQDSYCECQQNKCNSVNR